MGAKIKDPTELEWNIFPGFDTLQLCGKVKDLLEKHQKMSQEEFYSCRCSTTFPLEQKTMNKNVWHTLESYLCMQGGLVQDNGHSLVRVLRNSGTLFKRTVHKESGTLLRKRCWWNSPKADVQFSVQRLHCPEVNSKAKDMVNCRITIVPT